MLVVWAGAIVMLFGAEIVAGWPEQDHGDVGFALVFLVIGLLLLLLPSPWNLIVLGACLVLFIGELAFWNGPFATAVPRRARKP